MTTTTAAKPADAPRAAEVPNDLEAFWLPVHAQSRVQEEAAADLALQGHALLHARGARDPRRHRGLWCCNAGHNRAPDRRARSSARRPSSTSRRPSSSPIRWPSSSPSRLADLAPGDLDHVFFCNSGSEAVDTALKIALAYHNVRGHGLAPAAHRPRARLSRRRLRRHLGRRHGQQPQVLRLAAGRRRSSARDLQPRAPGLHQGRAGMGRPSRRRAREHRRPARRLDHRRGDRRADGGLDRRPAARPRAI